MNKNVTIRINYEKFKQLFTVCSQIKDILTIKHWVLWLLP